MNKNAHSHGTGYVTLTTGDVFEGTIYGAPLLTSGEVVFHTGMTGYQEVMTDPSFAGQIVTFTYPLIGNYGVNELDNEAHKPALAGMIVGDLCEKPSHFRSRYSLAEVAEKHSFPILAGIDTRTITKLVRDLGNIYGVISDRPLSVEEVQAFRAKRKAEPVVASVSCEQPVHFPGKREHIVLIDLGAKQSIITELLAMGCRVTAVPYNTTYAEIKALQPDGLVLSNGPGDPMEMLPYLAEWKKAVEQYPTLGICLGHQVLALMYGAKTERLPYGHRGSNHPVKELATGKVYLTSQNHGYVVKEDSLDKNNLAITYRNVNDGTVEGIRHHYLPMMSVQFHPEAHPGPSDTSHIFTSFIQSLQSMGAKHYA
ncbi:carbamoyl phosphate synthase small subunit [Brevibacillus dissolubilis]|uniref:carbamoyl phosphate synthase small subunit n=1 Tax=Brevibacillus dissolubilis TaxID=1844116 RepID=UPI0011172604|nr:carbamoyl phosphate synthase small subunit [Brevibacillus dissolubilis]